MAGGLERLGGPTYILAVLLSAAAWGCSIASTAYCAYVTRDITLDPGYNSTLPEEVEEVVRLAFEDHGVGFWAWQLAGSCVTYCTSAGACPNFDTKFRSAKAFTTVTDILGGLAFFLLLFQMCNAVEEGILRFCALFFLLSTLFEGLTLLILRSNVCTEPGFFNYLYPFYPPEWNLPEVQSVSCSLSLGSNLTIAATVCWFFAALVTAAVRPKDKGEGSPEEQAPEASG